MLPASAPPPSFLQQLLARREIHEHIVRPVLSISNRALGLAQEVLDLLAGGMMALLEQSQLRERQLVTDLEASDSDYEALLTRLGAMEIALEHEQTRTAALHADLTSVRQEARELRKASELKVYLSVERLRPGDDCLRARSLNSDHH